MNSLGDRAASSETLIRVPAVGPAAQPKHGRVNQGVLFVIAATMLFAVNGTVSKSILNSGLSSLELVEIRCLAAAAIFFVIAAVRAPSALRVTPRQLARIAVYGIVGVAMVQWLYYVSISRMPVSIALLIEFTAPAMIALWVRFGRRQPVKNQVWAALALIAAGLALVAQVWQGLTLDGVGVLAGVLAAVALAVFFLLGESAVGGRNSWAVAAWSFTASAAFWSVVAPWWHFSWARLGTTATVGSVGHAPVWLLTVDVIVMGTVLPFSLILKALGSIGATRVGLLSTLEPPLAGLVAWVAMGEGLGPVQLVGGAIVLVGIVLAETARVSPGARTPGRRTPGRRTPGRRTPGTGDQQPLS